MWNIFSARIGGNLRNSDLGRRKGIKLATDQKKKKDIRTGDDF